MESDPGRGVHVSEVFLFFPPSFLRVECLRKKMAE